MSDEDQTSRVRAHLVQQLQKLADHRRGLERRVAEHWRVYADVDAPKRISALRDSFQASVQPIRDVSHPVASQLPECGEEIPPKSN